MRTSGQTAAHMKAPSDIFDVPVCRGRLTAAGRPGPPRAAVRLGAHIFRCWIRGTSRFAFLQPGGTDNLVLPTRDSDLIQISNGLGGPDAKVASLSNQVGQAVVDGRSETPRDFLPPLAAHTRVAGTIANLVTLQAVADACRQPGGPEHLVLPFDLAADFDDLAAAAAAADAAFDGAGVDVLVHNAGSRRLKSCTRSVATSENDAPAGCSQHSPAHQVFGGKNHYMFFPCECRGRIASQMLHISPVPKL